MLHVPAVLATHFIQGMGNLPKRAVLYRFHQFGKQVFACNGRLL
jgi:hypothetical protein